MRYTREITELISKYTESDNIEGVPVKTGSKNPLYTIKLTDLDYTEDEIPELEARYRLLGFDINSIHRDGFTIIIKYNTLEVEVISTTGLECLNIVIH